MSEILLPDGTTLTMRAVVPSDANAFTEHRRALGLETHFTMQYPGRIYPSSEETARQLGSADPAGLRYGVFASDSLVAMLSVYADSSVHPWIKHLAGFGLGIRKAYWGLGLARALLAKLDEHAKTAGLTKIEGQVRQDNERAISLYLRNGFTIEGVRRQAAAIDGKFFDDLYIAKFY